MTVTFWNPPGPTTTVYLDDPDGSVGPLAGIDYHVALGYYPEDPTISFWNVAQWDTAGALWEGAAPLDDVSCDVVSVALTEGRDVPLARFRPGAATVVLNDPDGRYTPWRTADDPEAFAAIRVGIDLVVWADIGGTTYPRFRGTVESIDDEFPDVDGQHRVTFHALDYLSLLAAYDGTEQPATGTGELTGARLGRIVANAGYTGATQFDAGSVAVQATTLARNALDEAGITVDTELGALWCDRDGVLQFRDRNGLLDDENYTTPQAVIGDAVDATEYRPVSASSPDPYTYGSPSLAIDGDPDSWWLPDASVTHARIFFDRGPSAPPMGAVWHRWYDRDPGHHFQPVDYNVVGSPDGVTYYVLASVTGNTSTNRVDDFVPTSFRWFGLDITAFEATGEAWAHLALVDITWFEEEICYTDIALASNTDEIRNIVSIANAGGTAVTRSDLVSVSLYHPRTHQRFDLIHVDPAQSTIIADRHLDFFAYAANRVEAVTVDLVTLNDVQRATILGLDTLHRFTLRRRPEGFQVVAELQVQGMSERVDADKWTVTFRTFSASAVFDVGRWDVDKFDSGLWGY